MVTDVNKKKTLIFFLSVYNKVSKTQFFNALRLYHHTKLYQTSSIIHKQQQQKTEKIIKETDSKYFLYNSNE